MKQSPATAPGYASQAHFANWHLRNMSARQFTPHCNLGGLHGRDDDDRYWTFEVPPFQITIANPRVIELTDVMEVVFSLRVSERDFSKLVSTILDEPRSEPQSMLVWDSEFEVKAPDQAADSFGEAIRNEFAKVAQLDVQTVIRDLVADLPDRPLGRQIDHLAALA